MNTCPECKVDVTQGGVTQSFPGWEVPTGRYHVDCHEAAHARNEVTKRAVWAAMMGNGPMPAVGVVA